MVFAQLGAMDVLRRQIGSKHLEMDAGPTARRGEKTGRNRIGFFTRRAPRAPCAQSLPFSFEQSYEHAIQEKREVLG